MSVRIRGRAISSAFLWSSLALLGQQESHVPKPAGPIKVVLVGDSTVAVQGGWGPGFCSHLIKSAECLDLAVNGRSTKSYIDEGLWANALQARGQFYFIQFGHNDQKMDPALHTDPKTTYRANLRRFVEAIREIRGTPILVTPLSRRNYVDGELSDRQFNSQFKVEDPLSDYAEAVREVAAEEDVPLIDLYKLSTALLASMTQQEADRYDRNTRDGVIAANPDRTHLNEFGKRNFGDMVAHAAARDVPTLGHYIVFVSLPGK
jgi:lysophospholipase L1-like esterase